MISKKFYKFRKYPENAKCQPYCRTPELIENYDLAMADKERTWMCHHKLFAVAKISPKGDVEIII